MKRTRPCHECPVGVASGIGKGQFCPWIERTFQPGETLCQRDESADYVWFIKSGELSVEGDAPRAPGNFVGIEALVEPRYRATARARTKLMTCGATRAGLMQWLTGDPQRMQVLLSDVLGADTQTTKTD